MPAHEASAVTRSPASAGARGAPASFRQAAHGTATAPPAAERPHESSTEPVARYHTCRISNDGCRDSRYAGTANSTRRSADAISAGRVLPMPCSVLDPAKMMPLATKFQLTMRRYSEPNAMTAGSRAERADQRVRRDVAQQRDDDHHAAAHRRGRVERLPDTLGMARADSSGRRPATSRIRSRPPAGTATASAGRRCRSRPAPPVRSPG